MGVLNLVHELMHSFGAKHDPEATEEPQCTPHDKVRKIVVGGKGYPINYILYGVSKKILLKQYHLFVSSSVFFETSCIKRFIGKNVTIFGNEIPL